MTAMNSYNTCSVDSQNVLQVQSYHPQLWWPLSLSSPPSLPLFLPPILSLPISAVGLCPCLAESFREYHSTIVSSSPYSFPRIGPILTVEEFIQTGNYCGSSPNLSSLLIFMMNSLTLSLEPGPRNHSTDLIYGLEPDLLCILATCGNFS